MRLISLAANEERSRRLLLLSLSLNYVNCPFTLPPKPENEDTESAYADPHRLIGLPSMNKKHGLIYNCITLGASLLFFSNPESARKLNFTGVQGPRTWRAVHRFFT